jgi:hypothetical protein
MLVFMLESWSLKMYNNRETVVAALSKPHKRCTCGTGTGTTLVALYMYEL